MFFKEHNDLYWISGAIPKIGHFGMTLVSFHNPDIVLDTGSTYESDICNFDQLIVISK